MIPYKILNVPYDADSATIRQAYLAAVKNHPPERAPEQFKKINEAYEAIKEEHLRIQREIGDQLRPGSGYDSPQDAAVEFFRADLNPQPPSEEEFFQFLKA